MLGKVTRASSASIALRRSAIVPRPQPPPRRPNPFTKPTPRVAMLASLDFELDDDVTSDDVFVDTVLSDPAAPAVANDADITQPAPARDAARITLPGPPPEPPTQPLLPSVVPAPAPADLVARRDALSSQEAKVIVSHGEEELRAKLHAEVLAVVRAALASQASQQRPDTLASVGAAVRWMLAGMVLGAMIVYVLMASALHKGELLLTQASTPATVFVPQASPPAPTTKGAPLVCPASPADVIPTVDVSALPKAKPHVTRPLRRVTTPAPAATSSGTVDEANPYDGVSADGTSEPTL